VANSTDSGRHVVTRSDMSGVMTRPVDDRRFDVQQYTGYATSTVPAGQWRRGTIHRFNTPALRPSGRNLFMYDPTDPGTWNNGER